MANVQLTEEKANSKYQEGYNDSRYGSGGDFFDEIFELAEGIVEMSVTAMSLGVINFDSESEKYDAGCKQGERDGEEYDNDE